MLLTSDPQPSPSLTALPLTSEVKGARVSLSVATFHSGSCHSPVPRDFPASGQNPQDLLPHCVTKAAAAAVSTAGLLLTLPDTLGSTAHPHPSPRPTSAPRIAPWLERGVVIEPGPSVLRAGVFSTEPLTSPPAKPGLRAPAASCSYAPSCHLCTDTCCLLKSLLSSVESASSVSSRNTAEICVFFTLCCQQTASHQPQYKH